VYGLYLCLHGVLSLATQGPSSVYKNAVVNIDNTAFLLNKMVAPPVFHGGTKPIVKCPQPGSTKLMSMVGESTTTRVVTSVPYLNKFLAKLFVCF
jgi:hypothetical protein